MNSGRNRKIKPNCRMAQRQNNIKQNVIFGAENFQMPESD